MPNRIHKPINKATPKAIFPLCSQATSWTFFTIFCRSSVVRSRLTSQITTSWTTRARYDKLYCDKNFGKVGWLASGFISIIVVQGVWKNEIESCWTLAHSVMTEAVSKWNVSTNVIRLMTNQKDRIDTSQRLAFLAVFPHEWYFLILISLIIASPLSTCAY